MTDTALHQESGEQSAGTRAVGYANSLLGHFTAQETLRRGRAAVEHYAAMGLITFPEPEKPKAAPKPRGRHKNYSDAYRIKKVEEIHQYRREGMTAKAATHRACVAWQTYYNWQDQTGIKYSA